MELTTESVVRHTGDIHGAEAAAHRSRIRGEQAQMKTRLAQNNATVLDGVDTVLNALFVQVPDADAARLAGLPGVKRVVPVRLSYPVLDQAVLLHNVPSAWDLLGGINQAGSGIKIAIIDTGIDVTHPGFQDSTLTAPASFPRSDTASDMAYTSGKIIVARSYVNLLPNNDPDPSARDRQGHGTAVAMVAAGVRNAGPMATITGVAPKAYLGNYKVFGSPTYNDSSNDAAIIKAIEDAVLDGMDIISLSLGDPVAPRVTDDIEVQAVQAATQAGVIVSVAAGNAGPDPNTMSSPATAPSAIAVGASSNSRTFAAQAILAGNNPFVAIPGNGPAPGAPITANVVDVLSIDGNGQACSTLPPGSLTGQIALILRGNCTFQLKLTNAQAAGAIGGLVFAAASSPDAVAMDVAGATLPAMMVGNQDGVTIQQAISSQPLTVTLNFSLSSTPVAPNRLTEFTGAGPNVDLGVKPDLVAVGQDMYTAAETFDSTGPLYDPSGYALVDGTSFSTPLVSGAAALVKSAHPGLTLDQYRSLLINSTAPVRNHTGQSPSVQQAGAGLLDVNAAMNSTITAYPTSLSFGAGDGNPRVSRTLTLGNIGSADDTYTISVSGTNGVAASVSSQTIAVAAGSTAMLTVSFSGSGLTPGGYEGMVNVSSNSTGIQINVPYWYGATSTTPAVVSLLNSIPSGRRGSSQIDAFDFRIVDSSGVVIAGFQPQVTVVSGGGSVRAINNIDGNSPGAFSVDVRLGSVAGSNVFRVTAGSATVDVAITGQ